LMRFYIDGSLVKEITTNLPIKPAYLLIAGYIGQPGDVVRGVPDSTTPNPTKIQVTHVEVWRPGT
jgi:signal peptidase I